jgi:hypothetical protein
MTNELAAIKTYRVTRFSEIEGNNAQGWRVYNFVTGISQETVYPTYQAARDAALFVGEHYKGIERKAGW